MNVKQCDRCGKQFQEPPAMMKANLPLYLIFVEEIVPYTLRKVDLCDDCTKDFGKWMNGGKKQREDGETDDGS